MAERQSREMAHVMPDPTIEEAAAIMERDGAVIVEDMLPEHVFQESLAALRTQLDASPVGTPAPLGEYTRTCGGLIGKAVHAAELVTHPMMLGVAERFWEHRGARGEQLTWHRLSAMFRGA